VRISHLDFQVKFDDRVKFQTAPKTAPAKLDTNQFDDELNKIVDMISTRFNKRKLSNEWDDWRDSLPKIFPEKSVGKLSWFEDGDGVPDFSIAPPSASSMRRSNATVYGITI